MENQPNAPPVRGASVDAEYVARLEAAYVRALFALIKISPEYGRTPEFARHATLLFRNHITSRPWFVGVRRDAMEAIDKQLPSLMRKQEQGNP